MGIRVNCALSRFYFQTAVIYLPVLLYVQRRTLVLGSDRWPNDQCKFKIIFCNVNHCIALYYYYLCMDDLFNNYNFKHLFHYLHWTISNDLNNKISKSHDIILFRHIPTYRFTRMAITENRDVETVIIFNFRLRSSIHYVET